MRFSQVLILICVLCFSQLYSGQYAVNKIPKELIKDTDAVVRIRNYNLEITSKNEAHLKVTEAVTIFKKSKEAYGEFAEYYNNFINIDDIEGYIYDANGELIRELESSDIEDQSAVSNYSLYEDTRVKTAELYHNVYPYTVEFIYELSYDGYLGFPKWYARNNTDPVEKSRFTVVAHNNNLRYWCNQDSTKPLVTQNGNITTYLWKADNLPKLSGDAVGDYIEDVTPVVYIAPNYFELDDYSGNLNSWKDFGLWYFKLIHGRDKLPKAAINEILSLAVQNDNLINKVKSLYRYFQARTRYVSIQLGIGGWQPFDAEFVHSRGYGDCKALVNYMMSILRTANIKSYPVLINSGKHRYPMITEFPSNQFNHVILCVPLESDTLWLECTSQSAPAGYIGPGNENRGALMITPDGGILVKTPQSTSGDNLQVRVIEAKLNPDGSVKVNSAMKWTGNNMGYIQHILDHYSPEDQQKWILSSMEKPDCSINLFKFESLKEKRGITLMFNYVLPRYASVSNNRIFFNPNMMEQKKSVPNNVYKRLSPVIFSFPYKDIDTVYYEIPAGYKIESLPQESNFQMSIGEFNSKVQILSDSRLVYIRSFEIKDYSLPAEMYSDYRKFYSDLVKSDRSMIVLLKSQ